MEGKTMALYLIRERWGRVWLHAMAALRSGHWRWHLAGIGREMRSTCLIADPIPARQTAPVKCPTAFLRLDRRSKQPAPPLVTEAD
jgi:hypothetical protein